MKRIRFTPLFFRRIHKWVGLVVGLQFVLWSVSGAMMALIDMDEVGAHGGAEHVMPLDASGLVAPSTIAAANGADGIVLRSLAMQPVYEITQAGSTRLYDATTGQEMPIDRAAIAAQAGHFSSDPVRAISRMDEPNLEAREHAGPIWRVDFADEANTSAYFAADTGRLLVARGDAWRTWDFFWMLHNMDYVNRTSFNHPLIVIVAFATLFLSGTGFYLLFKSFARRDFRWILRRRKTARPVHEQGKLPSGT